METFWKVSYDLLLKMKLIRPPFEFLSHIIKRKIKQVFISSNDLMSKLLFAFLSFFVLVRILLLCRSILLPM